jgi:hypothetical protein
MEELLEILLVEFDGVAKDEIIDALVAAGIVNIACESTAVGAQDFGRVLNGP